MAEQTFDHVISLSSLTLRMENISIVICQLLINSKSSINKQLFWILEIDWNISTRSFFGSLIGYLLYPITSRFQKKHVAFKRKILFHSNSLFEWKRKTLGKKNRDWIKNEIRRSGLKLSKYAISNCFD